MEKKYNVIKKIGSGSFSTVYLCEKKGNLKTQSSLIFNTDFLIKPTVQIDYMIVKKIDINMLVSKYLKRNVLKINKRYSIDKTTGASVTPYNKRIDFSDNEEAYYFKKLRDLIHSEIYMLKYVSNENIVKYYDSNSNNNIYYIEMEYCANGDLYTNIKNNFKISDYLFKTFLKNISDGLLYLHTKGIIHRDIKPQNILINCKDDAYTFKLTDLGFACFLPNLHDSSILMSKSFFDENPNDNKKYLKEKYYKLCGTPFYMAPEIIKNVNNFKQGLIPEETNETVIDSSVSNIFYDEKIDIWSFGLCIYEVLFNKYPFDKKIDSFEKLHDLFEKDASFQATLWNNIDTNGKSLNINIDVLELLKETLTINPYLRISTTELSIKINNLISKNKTLIPEFTIVDQDDSDDLRVIPTKESWNLINNSSYLLKKISIDNAFLKWLFK